MTVVKQKLRFFRSVVNGLCLLLFLFMAACSSKVTSTGSTSGKSGEYAEDLSVWRPKDAATDTAKAQKHTNAADQSKQQKLEPKFTANQKLDAILDSIAEINLANGFIDGFTIQVYSGVRREDALNAKKDLSTYLPDLQSEVQYAQPNFRVRTGKYYGKIEAQKDYQDVKRYFPNAILIPDRIPIN